MQLDTKKCHTCRWWGFGEGTAGEEGLIYHNEGRTEHGIEVDPYYGCDGHTPKQSADDAETTV